MKSFNDHIEFFSWDFVFAEGDTIREKYVTLYETISSIISFNRVDGDNPYIIAGSGVISAFVVLDGVNTRHGEKITFDFAKQDNAGDVLHYGYLHSRENGFEIYQDPNAPKDQILICSENKLSILKLFNYPC